MRLKQHRLMRRFALPATAAMMAMALALVWGAGSAAASTNYACPGNESLENVEPVGGIYNTACGYQALKFDYFGAGNVASGASALYSNTGGGGNVASGEGALYSNTEGAGNVASGEGALYSNSEGNANVASGDEALYRNTHGDWNVASGVKALYSNTEGNANVAIGIEAGYNLTTGSNNVDVSNEGVTGESGTTRIGTEGKQTKAFVAGVYPTPVAGCTVQVTSSGQLGCNSSAGATGATGPTGATGATGATGPAGNAAIATFASFHGVPSGNCLNYTELAGQGNGRCPRATTGFSNSNLLAGPTPANGATVTNLYADTNVTLSKEEATVTVIDNTTGKTLLSCKVTTGKSSCSNTTEEGSAAPGDNIEVQVTVPGSRCNNKASWRVRFRY